MRPKARLLPVSVISGFLGAGKTTLLNNLLGAAGSRPDLPQRIAVIVNDMSEINIDAGLVVRQREELVEMSNGCICCTLRGDLLKTVAKLAKSGKYDYLLIESTGISEPLPVAQTFTFDEDGQNLRKITRLENMISVIDAPDFWNQWRTKDTLADRRQGISKDDYRAITDLLAEQVEFADLILVNKRSLISDADWTGLEKAVRALNPRAEILATDFAAIPPEQIFGKQRFDYEMAMGLPAWEAELRKVHIPESVEFGITHMTFKARRAFNPLKLYKFLEKDRKGLLRIKGPVWIAGHEPISWIFHLAGRKRRLEFSGFWWASVDSKHWPRDKEELAEISANMAEPWGDRRQELVFIGVGMDWDSLSKDLEACLLDEETMRRPDTWKRIPDPFQETWKEAMRRWAKPNFPFKPLAGV